MSYDVQFTEQACWDLRSLAAAAAAESPERLTFWMEELEQLVEPLRTFPHYCPAAPEGKRLQCEIRQIQYGRHGGAYRVLFLMKEETVQVLHIHPVTD